MAPLSLGAAMALKYRINPDFQNPDARTICEVLRELCRDARDRGDAVAMDRIAEAYDMAKRMEVKLREYRAQHPVSK